MAPKAPIGENFITIPTILKKISETCSNKLITGFAFSPNEAAAKPNNTAANNVGNNSPFASAPTKCSGIMLEMKAPIPCSDSAAAVVYCEMSDSPACEVSNPLPA